MEAFPYLYGWGTANKVIYWKFRLKHIFCILYLLMLDSLLKKACLYANIVK